jgi:hydroxyacylglutathione hydrolase
MKIEYVIDTHIHTEHLSTGRPPAEAAGADYILFAGAEVRDGFRAVHDRDILPLGNVVIEAVHTPGHTPEHVSLLVTDRTRSAEPWLLLTGHTLMVGDVGRTELAANAEEGARTLFRSLQLLKALPDHVEVLPGAYSGSVCGRQLSDKPTSTIGFREAAQLGVSNRGEAALVTSMLVDMLPPPPRAAELRASNAGWTPS